MEDTIDLHTHSSASDGSDTPSELVRKAEEAGLAAVALCDHDTVSGIQEFLEASGKTETVPGIEISTRLFKKEIHIIGLFVDPRSPALLEPLAYLRRTRIERNRKILERLGNGGFEVTENDVAEFAQGESIGRPHIAKALVAKGYFEDVHSAFVKCLKPGTPFYIPRDFLPPDQSIRIIHEAGGSAFWAHPMHGPRGDRAFLKKFLRELISWGLDGLEGYYSLFTERQHGIAMAMANERNLPVSGGSDYHGENQPSIQLGRGCGTLKIPYSVLEAIRQYRKNKK